MLPIRRKCSWLVLPLLILAAPLGLGADEPTSPPGKSQTPQDRRKPPDDKSLPLADYIAAGMPAYDRTWSGADMEKALKVLQEVAKDRNLLPRYGSDRSGKLFDRIVSEDNLRLYQDPAIPFSTRFSMYAQYTEAINGITKMYVSVASTDANFAPDFAEIAGAGLRTIRTGLTLTDQKLATFDRSHPQYAAAMAAAERGKRGMATVVAGCFQMLEELPGSQSQTRKRLVAHLQATLPDIMPRLPPGSRAEFKLRLEKMVRAPSMKDIQPDLESLVKRLQEKRE